jgi:hypothetical protein
VTWSRVTCYADKRVSDRPDKLTVEYERRNDAAAAKRLLARTVLAPVFAVALFTGYVGALATTLGIIFLLGAFPEIGLPTSEKIVLVGIGPPLAACGYALARVYRRLVRRYVLSAPRTEDTSASDASK